jgi:outer membrane autotransporter protein
MRSFFSVKVAVDELRRSLKCACVVPDRSGFSSAGRAHRKQPLSTPIAILMNSSHGFHRVIPIFLLLSFGLPLQRAHGQLFWDPTPGALNPNPSGFWDRLTPNWSATPGMGSPTGWVNTSNAVFAASELGPTGGYTVTLAQSVSIGNLTYTGGTLGSTLQILVGLGTTLTMSSREMNVAVDFGTTLFVAPIITGNGGLNLQGGGNLVLTAVNNYTGNTTITAGTLQLGSLPTQGSITGTVTNNDTFNLVNANTAGITEIVNTNGSAITSFSNFTTAGNAAIINNNGTANFFDGSSAGNAAITNNGGFIQFFDTAHSGNAAILNNGNGFTEFFDTSAADSTTITNTAGTTEFNNTSTADNATITNNANGLTNFKDTSTAGASHITNDGGETQFFDSSKAGNAAITTTNGGLTEFSVTSTAGSAILNVNNGGEIDFNNTSTAGNAIVTVSAGGTTQFFDASTAGNASIANSDSGATEFNNTSTAGNASITNIGGGVTEFNNTSTAGNATILNGGSSGVTEFFLTSTAAHSTITNDTGSATGFFDTSTGGNAAITNISDGFTVFEDASTAGNAMITDGPGGFALFEGTSTAGHAAITNGPGAAAEFVETSMAGNAIITNNSGGVTVFSGTSTGANSTIITNSGGTTEFIQASTGGQARLITNAEGNVNIAGLTSAGMTAGSIEGAGTYFLGSKVLTVGLNNLSTVVSGVIVDGGPMPFTSIPSNEGGGALIKVGTGTLTLTGLNTYTGGTSFDGGTLAVNSDANLGAGPLSFNGGTLQARAIGGGITSTKAVTLNAGGGTFLADPGTASTFSGVISGPGALVKAGLGTLTLMGTNTYTGGTSFNDGTLAMISDANLGTGPLSFNGGSLQALAIGGGIRSTKAVALKIGGGTFLADAGTTSTFSGAISGLGSLTKDGLGALDLAGLNTYQGGTILNAGTLTVNGAQALGLGNVTVNGGVLRADPQPINVKGNYTQNAGGTLQLQVAGANPGQYDSLNVGGNAALGGTLQLISLGFQPKEGNLLTLVSTGGVVSGRFAQLVDPFTAEGAGFAIAGLVYESNAVLLEFRTAASFALTPNQLAAASLIDAVHLDPRALKLISFLNTEPFANLPGDFEKISPDSLTAFYEISFSNANIQKLTLEGRLDDLRAGSSGFSSNMKVNGAIVNLEDRADADGKSSKAEPILQPGPENRWGVWMTGFGDFVNVDGDGNAHGYDFTTGGVSLGIDYRITDQLAIGAMGDYSHTWTALQPSGHIDVDSGRGGLYATWFSHGMYLNGAIYGGHNNYDSSRAALGGLATGGTEGAEWSTFVSAGYDFHISTLTIGPIASLQYTDVGIDSFGEKGSLAPLQIHSDSAESLRSDVGFRAFYQWKIGKVLLEPSLRAAWEHEYKYSALPITAGFAGIPGPTATFFGPNEGHDSAVISAGVSVRLTPAITTYLNYDGQLGRGNYDSNAVTGGVRVSF